MSLFIDARRRIADLRFAIAMPSSRLLRWLWSALVEVEYRASGIEASNHQRLIRQARPTVASNRADIEPALSSLIVANDQRAG
jgi:hypothetical protein